MPDGPSDRKNARLGLKAQARSLVASTIAWRSDPVPLSSVFTTVVFTVPQADEVTLSARANSEVSSGALFRLAVAVTK